eukprot:TRINITY_DN3836_c0_g1_i1.p1 TRINITY_DN3836_c0_g1~~TRINITY_DN3836_c0_g1_i1.p1  ORF type:complete len:257 (+),score=89.30 TRINITY_DN3836_c0_g1_i1:531-1301(+)
MTSYVTTNQMSYDEKPPSLSEFNATRKKQLRASHFKVGNHQQRSGMMTVNQMTYAEHDVRKHAPARGKQDFQVSHINHLTKGSGKGFVTSNQMTFTEPSHRPKVKSLTKDIPQHSDKWWRASHFEAGDKTVYSFQKKTETAEQFSLDNKKQQNAGFQKPERAPNSNLISSLPQGDRKRYSRHMTVNQHDYVGFEGKRRAQELSTKELVKSHWQVGGGDIDGTEYKSTMKLSFVEPFDQTSTKSGFNRSIREILKEE